MGRGSGPVGEHHYDLTNANKRAKLSDERASESHTSPPPKLPIQLSYCKQQNAGWESGTRLRWYTPQRDGTSSLSGAVPDRPSFNGNLSNCGWQSSSVKP